MILPPNAPPCTQFGPSDPVQQYNRGYLHAVVDVVDLVLDGFGPDELLARESAVMDAVFPGLGPPRPPVTGDST